MIRLGLLTFLILATSAHAFDWQGHRGARGLYPENTIGAMEEALKYPVTTLELDVVLSKDSQIVVTHEPWMNGDICLDPNGQKIKDKKFIIFQMTYEQITKFDCGSLGHPDFPQQKKINTGKPTLDKLITVTEETLKNLSRKAVVYNIEIKSTPQDEKNNFQPDVKTFSDNVVKMLMEKLPLTKFTIQSFDWRVLQYIHKTYPKVRLVALKDGPLSVSKDLKELGFNPAIFSPHFKFLTPESVDVLHKLKIKVVPWTVNNISDMKTLVEMGVDGIITDFPDRILDAEKKKCKEGTNLFEGRCIKVPSHALPSDNNPGWICKSGYVQKRSRCIKISVPPHGHLTPDGKSWKCDKGFERYRGACKRP